MRHRGGVCSGRDRLHQRGVNLQHMANQVVHYELPWKNRLEQRNGRLTVTGSPERGSYPTFVMRYA